VFYFDDTKLGGSWKVVHKWINRNIYDIPTMYKRDNAKNDEGCSDNIYQKGECVRGNMAHVDKTNVEAST
jgi:hypothetical protein